MKRGIWDWSIGVAVVVLLLLGLQPILQLPVRIEPLERLYAWSRQMVQQLADPRWLLAVVGALWLPGVWRLYRLPTLSPHWRLGLLLGLWPAAVAVGVWGGWDAALWLGFGLGASLAWGVCWSEGCHAFLGGGRIARLLWPLLGTATGLFLLIGNTAAIGVTVLAASQGLNAVGRHLLIGLLIIWLLCLAGLAPLAWRSVRARRAARRFLAAGDAALLQRWFPE